MRRFIIHIVGFVAAAAAALAAVACDPVSELPVAEFGNCSLRVSFTVGDPATKAVSSTAEWDGDETVSSAQLVLFKADGTRVASFGKDDLTYDSSAKRYTKTLSSLTVGTYTVAVFVNQPAVTATTLSAAKAASITLSSASVARKSGSTPLGVPGYGEASVTVAATNTPASPAAANVTVSKIPFRVMLKSLRTNIVNGSPVVDIQSAFLTNAFMTSDAAGEAAPTGMVNKAGRNGSTKMTTAASAEAAYADWTVRDISVSGVGNAYTLPDAKKGGFYAFRNPVAAGSDSFNGAFTAETTERTRLVVAATWDGTQCWYPVTIPSPMAGYSYDVSLTITGPGSDDPNKPVVHGNIVVTVTVTPWIGGEEIDATM